MKVAEAALYSNHPFLILGSTSDVDWQLDGSRSRVIESSAEHVHVGTRGQIALTKVTVWRGNGVLAPNLIFDGRLTFADERFAVHDFERVSSLQVWCVTPGEHRVTISVDDPAEASRISVILDGRFLGSELPQLSRLGHSIMLDQPIEELSVDTAIDLALSAYDHPLARLETALDLAIRAGELDASRRPLVEWMRWLDPGISIRACEESVEYLFGRIADQPDHKQTNIHELATQTLTRLGVGPTRDDEMR